MLRPPLLGPAGAACRRNIPAAEQIDFLLALDDQNATAERHGLDKIGQAIQDAARVVEVPQPGARPGWIRAALLRKSFGSKRQT